jgi:hypothetical protein
MITIPTGMAARKNEFEKVSPAGDGGLYINLTTTTGLNDLEGNMYQYDLL